jgi:hypothetical protein
MSGHAILSATASLGTILWFNTPTGGFAAGSGPGFTTPVISATTTYYVMATSGGCTTPARVAVVATVLGTGECGSKGSNQGVQDEASFQSVRVFPNPNNGDFSVEIPFIQKDASISVMDISGRELAAQLVADNDGSPVTVKLNPLAAGLYLVRVNAGQYSTVVRLVVQ